MLKILANVVLFNSATNSITDAIKTASKTAFQKTAGGSGDLIGNKIADKITSVSKILPQNALKTDENELETSKRSVYISQKRQKIIDELRLV